jgi:uncharacterized protein
VKGFGTTTEGAALIGRTAKHFAHKIPVTTSDGHASIETRFGRADLTASDDGIAIALTPVDANSAEQLRDVIASHLTRFARTPLEITW